MGARFLSAASRGHAPLLGEMNLLFLFTRQPAADVRIVTGGHLTLLVWISFALTLGIGSVLLWLTFRRCKTWLQSTATARVPLMRVQLALWGLLIGLFAGFALTGRILASLAFLLAAQLLPRRARRRLSTSSE
jgi:hypothetical protein